MSQKYTEPIFSHQYSLTELAPSHLGMTKQSVEGAAGGPPAQLGPGLRLVDDELVGGEEPGHQDLLLLPGLGAAVVTGDERVHLADGDEERRGDEGEILGEDAAAGLLTAEPRPVLCHVLYTFNIDM